ncbi:MAG: Ppx/GppA family phosphatase [Pseudobdellovibrio sp.]
MKIASLDLGSNTFLCLISEVEDQKIKNVMSDHVEVVRLGQGLSQSKKFHPEALKRAEACLKRFKGIIEAAKPDAVLAMATSAARDAENRDELFKICKDLDIPLEIIPGDKEAEITYRGSVSGVQSNAHRLVVDIGGGSTEFIFGQGSRILNAKSLDIGCVRLTEKFIPNQPTNLSEIESLQKYIYAELKKIKQLSNESPAEILAVAGTPTTIAAVEIGYFDPKKIDNYKLTRENLLNWLTKLTGLSVAEKIKLGFPEGRADVILVGIVILIETLNLFKKDEILVSTRGVRYGVALELAHRFNS